LQATFDGWSLALADIPAAAQIVTNSVVPDSPYGNVEYQTQSLEQVARYMLSGIEPAALGTIEGDRWMQMAQQFAKYGIIERVPDLEKSLATGFWMGSQGFAKR
jgi:hypothetical protein